MVQKCLHNGLNVGVRLRASQLVLDVDPRNGGVAGWTDLCLDLGISPRDYPCVVTGSGGLHLYMVKPADVKITDTVEGYRGVEFKSFGRQVVAAGSRHPNGRLYRWHAQHPPLSAITPAPPELIALIKRPAQAAYVGGAQASCAEIERALAALDPCDFREHSKWFALMCACHHASAGDARQEFVSWSTTDPLYRDHEDIIGRRWDSLHRERPKAITYRTLNLHLREAGAGHLCIQPTIEQTTLEAIADFMELSND